ncbi:MAG TPA: serine hydrolase [Magnetospirillaceae bacterium]|nr:serine hydrolase [Magnetospirillaceae bacterium]
MKRLLAVVLAALACWPVLAAEAPLTLVLTSIPDDTPAEATIYVTGSFNHWNNGDPRYRLSKDPDGQYAITIPAQGKVEFKFTLGTWDSGEQEADGKETPWRNFIMPSSGPATYSGKVAKWYRAPRSIEELKGRLEKILADTHTPGLLVAIVNRNGPEWTAGMGLADVASNRPATADTLFRIGSVSKAFAGMAILKLADEGKLSLQDSVRKVAPEVAFENPWEATDPVRIVDLLEHTTGWDDMHLAEYAKDGTGLTTQQTLDFYKGSRVSRWRPGTRWSYCNTGPAVAAFIVEKLTGQRFEDYVTQNLFLPLGMKSATYFEPKVGDDAATLYKQDGKTPLPYWNIIFRPAGAIDASANDMAAYLSFYLRRGAPVLAAADVERMETPTRSWAAQQGLQLGYGIYDMSTPDDGLVFDGHTGAVTGGFTSMAYLPEQGVGFAFSTNSGSGDAFGKIRHEIRAYVVRDIARLRPPPEAPLPADALNYEGWYEPAAPRSEFAHFAERLIALTHLGAEDGVLIRKGLVGPRSSLVPISGEMFRTDGGAVADTILLAPNDEGRFIETNFTTWRHIPTVLVWVEICLTALLVLALATVLLYAPFWLIASLRRKWRNPAEVWIKLFPLLTLVGYVALPLIQMSAGEDAISRFGTMTPWSVGLCIASWVIGLAPLAAAVALWQAHGTARRWVWRYSAWVVAMLLIGAGYLAYWGAIGIRIWA